MRNDFSKRKKKINRRIRIVFSKPKRNMVLFFFAKENHKRFFFHQTEIKQERKSLKIT